MKKLKNVVFLLLATIFIMSISACSSTDKTSGGGLYEKVGLKAKDVVMTINGEDVTAEEFFYVALERNELLEQYFGKIEDWDEPFADGETTYRKLLSDSILSRLSYIHSVESFAEEYGIELNENDENAIASAKDYIVANYFGTKDNYDAVLKNTYFISDDIFTYTNITVDYLYNKISSTLYDNGYLNYPDENTIKEYIDENGYMKAAHILIKTVDDDMEPLDEEIVEQKKKLVYDLYERINDGEDFFTLLEQYGEDPGMKSNPTGYTFNPNSSFVSEFIDGTAALNIGEYGIVESMYGYHILYRVEVDLDDMAQEICDEEFQNLVSARISQAESVFLKNYDKIDLETALK